MSIRKKKSRTYDREEVVTQYNRFAEASEEYQKVSWGSAASMENRFTLALKRLPLQQCASLLDVGCGTGMFLQRLANRYPTMRLQGVDVSDKLVAIARTQLQRHEVSIMLGSFLDIADRFDCITCIGVLQKTDMLLNDFFLHAFSCLEPGGELWVDTKHAGWDAFIAGERVPEQTHIHFSLTEIQSAALQNGFREIDCFGFLPGANETTSVAGSHTLIYRCMRPIGS